MYRITINTRDYSDYKIVDNKTGQRLENSLVDPKTTKLFNFDTFDIEKEEIRIINSPARETSIAGVLQLETNKTFGKIKKRFLYRCVPDDKRFPIFLVPFKPKIGFNKFMKNRYVIIYFESWKDKHPIARIDQNIGEVGELPNFYQYQLYCRSLNASIQNFTQDTMKQLKKQPENELVENIIRKYNIEERRKRNVITIDPKSSKDFDDAMGIVINKDFSILSIYIANVPLWLDYLNLWGSFSKRVSTIYLPDRKLPMLPTVLSDVLCSLQEDCSRFAFTIDIKVNNDTGDIIDYKFVNTVINVSKNYVYDSKEQEKNLLYNEVFDLVHKMNKRKKYTYNIKNCHDVVAYLMILMNHVCAKEMSNQQQGLFRSMSFSKTFDSTELTDNEEIQQFLNNWHSSGGNYNKYSDLKKHEALNLDKYLHITSPIRRLVDLLNIIKLQQILNLSPLSDNASEFYESWTSDKNLLFINNTMRSIRKVQSDCSLLAMCSNNKSILEEEYKGFIFDKMVRTDMMYQYQVYLMDIKVVRRFITCEDLQINTYNNFKLYLFLDEDRLYKKIRLTLKN
tara:strand:+ start:5876 stop:7570 length:1695 start_codon:yes stop_codon:yes gene_type:complete